jgi:putative flippase GtrA
MTLLQPITATTSSILAFIITLPVAYLSHARFSFSDRAYDTFQPLRFALTTAASFVVSTGGMYWITEIANRSYLLGIAWSWVMIPVMNLSIYLLWVFRAAHDAGKTE